jgi:hypothetical protein
LARDFAINRNQKSDIDFAEKAYKTTTEIAAGGTARTGNDLGGVLTMTWIWHPKQRILWGHDESYRGLVGLILLKLWQEILLTTAKKRAISISLKKPTRRRRKSRQAAQHVLETM